MAGPCSISGSSCWPKSIALKLRVNTHAHAEKMRAFLGSAFPSGYPVVSESFEPTLLGSGGTIAANAQFADDADEVIIIYADQLSTIDLRAMLAFHRQHGDPFTMLLYRVPNPTECGIVELDVEQRVIGFVEKPSRAEKRFGQRGSLHCQPGRLSRNCGGERI